MAIAVVSSQELSCGNENVMALEFVRSRAMRSVLLLPWVIDARNIDLEGQISIQNRKGSQS